MGLTAQNSGFGLLKEKGAKKGDELFRVCLVGNPNVGKSTIFNSLTGSRQHTGNWSGKTVELAYGICRRGKVSCEIVDLPGTYSLYAHSAEEAVAAEYILTGLSDVTAVICDSTNLERSLALLLQVMEVTDRVIAVFNLYDEAKRAGIRVDEKKASEILGIPVVLTSAKDGSSADRILNEIMKFQKRKDKRAPSPLTYSESIERAISLLSAEIGELGGRERFLSLSLLSGIECEYLMKATGLNCDRICEVKSKVEKICKELFTKPCEYEHISEEITSCLMKKAEQISLGISEGKRKRELSRFDKIITSKWGAYPTMMLLLFLVLYITVSLANYPSALLNTLFSYLGTLLLRFFEYLSLPPLFTSFLYDGIYTVLTGVVAVMLPPMAIFFPLFTLLEDVGLLPRLSYNLDAPFRCVGACGKQALTMCMGLGCNAAGITGCRIIDTKRERLLAVITNGFMPCNGKFPTVILLVGMFSAGIFGSFISALGLLLAVSVGVGATFLATFLLSKTVYRGAPSFFTLELPPYRLPNIPGVLFRSFVDRTLTVLLRAVFVAAPAGAVIWILATVEPGGVSLLNRFTEFLDPIGRLLGMDGVLLGAFILGLPANEIVLPIAIIGYTSMGVGEAMALGGVGEVLLRAGFTPVKAISTIIFSLMHWPCSTSLITVYKETKSPFAVFLSAFIPTLFGSVLCISFNLLASFFA